MDSLEGKRGNPRLKPPFPATRVYQGPTLSTTSRRCRRPAIVAMGGEEYAKLGVETSTGTKPCRSPATSSGPATTKLNSASPHAS